MTGRARSRGGRLALALVALAAVAPILVLVAAIGTRAGLWSADVGFDLLALRVAWIFSILGILGALAVVVLTVREPRRLWVYAVTAAVLAGVSLGGLTWQRARVAAGPPEDVTSDLTEVPGFSDAIRAVRGSSGPSASVGPEECPGARSLPTQVAPQVAAEALRAAGFTVRGAGVGRADGERRGYWFGFTHDAVVRIRPGRTDVRVAGRDARPQGGEACRLATRIVESLSD